MNAHPGSSQVVRAGEAARHKTREWAFGKVCLGVLLAAFDTEELGATVQQGYSPGCLERHLLVGPLSPCSEISCGRMSQGEDGMLSVLACVCCHKPGLEIELRTAVDELGKTRCPSGYSLPSEQNGKALCFI